MTRDELIAAGVDASLHEDPTLKEVPNVATALKQLVDNKAEVGRRIRIPSESAPAEEREAFRADAAKKLDLVFIPADEKKREEAEAGIFERLGRPKDKTGYPEIKSIVKEMPEGIQVDEGQLRDTASRLGLTKKGYATLVTETVEAAKKAAQMNGEQRAALKKELGDAMDERLKSAAITAKKLGRSDEYVQKLRNGAVSVEEARAWLETAKALGDEGSGLGGRDPTLPAKLTPDEAKMQLSELRRGKALMDEYDPGHEAAVKKLHELTAMAYPD